MRSGISSRRSRSGEFDHGKADAEIEILAEGLVAKALIEVLVGGREETDVDLDGIV